MTKEQDNTQNPFGFQQDFSSFFSAFPATLPGSAKSLMETQRRNIQAISEAQKNAMQSWQNLTQRQVRMVSQFVQDNAGLAQEIMKEGTPEEKVARQAEIFKRAYEVGMAQTQELASLIAQSNKETAEIINRRFSASINEIRDTLQTNNKAA